MKKNNRQKPFFSEFLENQLGPEQAHRIQGGDTDPVLDQAQTQKYPSDQEDDPTKKYPSDYDEDTTKPLLDQAQTQKYPSDGDDDLPPIDK